MFIFKQPIMLNRLIFTLSLLLTGISGLSAQGLFACQAPPAFANSCAATCITCDLNGVTGNTSIVAPPGFHPALCQGDLVVENPNWFGFIAGSTNILFAITPGTCSTGTGLEAAVLDNCLTTISCVPGPVFLNPAGAFIVQAAGLVVGRRYQLVIDGYNGSMCPYTISVISGSTVAPPLGTVDQITGNPAVCPKGTDTYSIPPVDNAVSYTWSAPAGAKINGGGNVVTLPATGNNNSVEITFGTAGGNVCVSVSNACSAPVTRCFAVSNVPIPPTVLPNATVCYEQIPYEWPEEPHTLLAAPGVYTLTSTPYNSYIGCDSVVRQTLRVLPLNQVTLPVKYLCKDECYEINGLIYCETGQFQETLVSHFGCDSIVNFTLVRIPAKAVVQQPDTITCAVTSVPLSGVGSTTGNTVTYRWLNPDGQVISNAITAVADRPGQYAFIVQNFIGGVACRDTAIFEVPGNLTPPLAEAGPDKVLTCVVTEVQLDGSGSTGPNYSYFWRTLIGGNIVSGATTLTPTVNAPGTYSLRVTDLHNGCTSVSNAVVRPRVTPPSVNLTGGAYTCTNPNLTIRLITDADAPSFVWNGPNGFVSTLQNPTVNVAGTYNVTITNGETGCTNTGSVQVVNDANPPAIAVTGGDITCNRNIATISVSSPVSGVTFAWTGPNGFVSSMASPTTTQLGDYHVTVTAPNGCSSTAVTQVVLNTTPPGTTLGVTNHLNCNSTSINLLATSIGNPVVLSHQWTLPGGNTTSTGNQAYLPVTIPGNYSVFVINTSTGCSSTAGFTVFQYGPVTAQTTDLTDARCYDSQDGSITAVPGGGNGVYTYQWNSGSTSSVNTGLAFGTYVVTVTDGEGCSATATATIGSPTAIDPNTSGTDQLIAGAADGTATASPLGGVPGYTFNWSSGDSTAALTGLLPGAYTVTVTDAAGCTAFETVNVNGVNCTLETQLVVSSVSCNGLNNGEAILDIQGGANPVNILWSTGDSVTTINFLPVGQYAVTVTDSLNCQEVQTFLISEPSRLQANAIGTASTGSNIFDGSATANPTGGTGIYVYNWSNGSTEQSVSNLAPDLYTVTVTDENGCEDVQVVEVKAGLCNLTADLLITNPRCSNSSDGSATVLISGSGGQYAYLWSNGSTIASAGNLPGGTHYVSVTDEAGCLAVVNVELASPAVLLVLEASNTPTSCADAFEGAAAVSVVGGTGSSSVLWSNGQAGLTAVGLQAGVFSAVATDDNGCTASVSITVSSTDLIPPVLSAVDAEVAIGPEGNVFLTQQNLNVQVTDNCGFGSFTTAPNEFNCAQLGDHQVVITATDNSGNISRDTITVTIVDNSAPSLICPPSLALCHENRQVMYQAPTASDNCLSLGGSFNLVAGLPIGSVFPVGSTTNTYSYTDANGNTGNCSFEITIFPEIVVSVDTVINDFNFQTIGAVLIDVSGGLPPLTYSWLLNGQQVSTAQDLSGSPAGDYTLVITDDNDCSVTRTFTISNTSATENPVLADGIRIFPNPANNWITVALPEELSGQETDVQVFDMTGRRVLSQYSEGDSQIMLSLSGFAEGLYHVMISSGSVRTSRIVVLVK
jgi:hypothetical protein